MDVIKVERTKEFNDWFEKESAKSQAQIEGRIKNIRAYGYFGIAKDLENGLAELKWKNGRRIYFANLGNKIILLLNGGVKNAQNKDIKKARKILKESI